ncbi:MAG: C40 family peptidase [Gemmatimonadaceae bacterium]|nr:C40 family peptidase [Gemmatimonadaceae bacterium]
MPSNSFTVRAAIAPLLGDARVSASPTSQLLAGEVVLVLEERGDWRRVQGPAGYEGWTHIGYLTDTLGDEADWPISLGCQVRGARGVLQTLPLGARVAPNANVVSGEAIAPSNLTTVFPVNATAIVDTARMRFEGSSYLWAGITPWGVDCSGLVQRAFALHGILLPRDAWQQAEATSRVADDAAALHAAGDLLFFSDRDDRRITHVGIATGDGHMVHSALLRGGVTVEHMADDADAYVKRLQQQCVGVHRVMQLAQPR